MSVHMAGRAIPVWKIILSITTAALVFIGTDAKSDIDANTTDIVELREETAAAVQFRFDVRNQLDRIEDRVDTLSIQKPDVAPLSRGTDLSPITKQLNDIQSIQRAQQQQIDRIYKHLSPQR